MRRFASGGPPANFVVGPSIATEAAARGLTCRHDDGGLTGPDPGACRSSTTAALRDVRPRRLAGQSWSPPPDAR